MSLTQFYQFRWRVNKENDRTQIGSSAIIFIFYKLFITYLLFLFGYNFKSARTLVSIGLLGYETFLCEICRCITVTELCWNVSNILALLIKCLNWIRCATGKERMPISSLEAFTNAAYVPFMKQNLFVSWMDIWEFNYNKVDTYKKIAQSIKYIVITIFSFSFYSPAYNDIRQICIPFLNTDMCTTISSNQDI